MKIAFGCDHAAYHLKEAVLNHLRATAVDVQDFGCNTGESCDYPDIAFPVGKAVASGQCERGILICGTGVGMAIAANKVKGVRAAVCWSDAIAVLVSEHNNANILCLPARFSSSGEMNRWIDIWLATPASTLERHVKRIAKISDFEAGK